MLDKILTAIDGSVARIVFDRPENRNAVSLEMCNAVEVSLSCFRDGPDIQTLTLSGAGGKAFVSGADISKFESERAGEEALAHDNATAKRVYDAFEAFPKPSIAQIDGYCVGGGVALSLCCDIRIRGDKAQFAAPTAKLDLDYPFPGIDRPLAVVGSSFANKNFFTARRGKECFGSQHYIEVRRAFLEKRKPNFVGA